MFFNILSVQITVRKDILPGWKQYKNMSIGEALDTAKQKLKALSARLRKWKSGSNRFTPAGHGFNLLWICFYRKILMAHLLVSGVQCLAAKKKIEISPLWKQLAA